MIRVVDATDQLGSLIVRELGRQGRPVRAMVRPPDPVATSPRPARSS